MELGLTLLQEVAPEEPATSVEALLKGYRFPVEQLQSDRNWQIIQNARFYLIQRKGRQWLRVLQEYINLPEIIRIYSLEDARDVPQLIPSSIYPNRLEEIYRPTLLKTPQHRQRKVNLVTEGRWYAKISQKGNSPIDIPKEVANIAPSSVVSLHRTRTQQNPPCSVTREELILAAQEMDDKLSQFGQQENYRNRLENILFQLYDAESNNFHQGNQLNFEGLIHIVGLLNVGKSTLLEILIYLLAKQGYRCGLMVNDVATAVRLASLFCHKLEIPAAPVLGSNRQEQLTKVYEPILKSEGKEVTKGGMHPAWRWFSPVCPLLALVQSEEKWEFGNEPCHKLYQKVPVAENDDSDDEDLQESDYKQYTCPFYYKCPLSVRRWLTQPLKYVPYPGVKAHIGDNRRWLDGQRQPFCFIPLMMNRYGKEVKWSQAISNLFSLNDSQLPDANNFVSNPNHNWSGINTISSGIQAAIAYTSKLGDPPCLGGVSPQDLASLDKAIEARLPVQRVGEAERVTGNVFIFWPLEKPKKKIVPLLADEENQSNKPKKAKKSDDPNHSHTPMLRPKLAASAVFREAENPLRTILILWETPQCRDALIAEICQLLYLSPTKVENIYQGSHGSLCIKTQHVGDLTQDLEIKNFSEVKKTYQQQRPDLLAERINKITAFLPQTQELSGALIEIRPKLFRSEADPKLAWRIGAMKAGYLNQHIHRITTKADPEKLKKSGLEPVKRAVSDLLRQFGILPDTPLINPKKDEIDPDVWLTCFYVLRRTRKTNAENIPKTVVLMIRVNPLTAKVELTTPNLFNEQGWVSYPVGLAHLSNEDWDSNSNDESNEELDDEQKRKEQTKEQKLINKFVAECLQDCLNTSITDKKSPRVLFMAEAQNARKMLNWLQNKNLVTNDPLQALKQYLSPEEINHLWIVRLRVAENGEVPVAIVKDSPGSRTSGVYRWQNVCDDGERSLYLSVRKPLNTEKHILRTWQSRLDNGSRQAGKARILEIALIHHPEIKGDKLAHFVHSLRSRWPYFANDVVLPLPFPFAISAKEYAISTKDPVQSSETDDSNF